MEFSYPLSYREGTEDSLARQISSEELFPGTSQQVLRSWNWPIVQSVGRIARVLLHSSLRGGGAFSTVQ